MKPEIQEEDLPGIGRRFRFVSDADDILTVVIHNTGRRDLYLSKSGDEEPAAMSMTDGQARTIGALLSGDYDPPAPVTDAQRVVDDMIIEWVVLNPGSPAADRSLKDLEVHELTGMTVLAILRGEATIDDPDYSHLLRAGDRLVVAGRREHLGHFRRLVVGGTP